MRQQIKIYRLDPMHSATCDHGKCEAEASWAVTTPNLHGEVLYCDKHLDKISKGKNTWVAS